MSSDKAAAGSAADAPGASAAGFDPFSSTASLPLLVRMPDGERHQVDVPPNTSIKDLKSTIAGMDNSLNPGTSDPSWDLDFGGSILDDKHTLQHYNIPDAYDHANGLLKTIHDSGYHDPDKKVEALDKAVAVVHGISRGEHDMERLISAVFEEQDNEPASPSAQPSLRAMRKSRRSRIPTLNFANLPPPFPLPPKAQKPSLPSAPPTPSQLLRRLSTSRPDLYDPSAVPEDGIPISPRPPTGLPAKLSAPEGKALAPIRKDGASAAAASSASRPLAPPVSTAIASSAPSSAPPTVTASTAIVTSQAQITISVPTKPEPSPTVAKLETTEQPATVAVGAAHPVHPESGELKRGNTWFTEVISTLANENKNDEHGSDEDDVEGDSEDEDTSQQSNPPPAPPATVMPVSSIVAGTVTSVTDPSNVPTSTAVFSKDLAALQNAAVAQTLKPATVPAPGPSTVLTGGIIAPTPLKPAGANGTSYSPSKAPMSADSSPPVTGAAKSEPAPIPRVSSPDGTIRSGVTSSMSASSAPNTIVGTGATSAPSSGNATGATSAPASASNATAAELAKCQPQVIGLTPEVGNTVVGADGKIRKKRGRKRKNPHLSEEERKAQRQAQNRESAKLSRIRRKKMTIEYEKRVTTLEGENENLRDTVAALTDRLEMLQNLLTISVQKRTVPPSALPQIAAATQQQVEAQLAGVPPVMAASRAMAQGPIAAARQLNAGAPLAGAAGVGAVGGVGLLGGGPIGLGQAPLAPQQQGAFATPLGGARGPGAIGVSSGGKGGGPLTNVNLDFKN